MINLLFKKDLYAIINNISPTKYSKSRNFVTGAVTKLSPYITHGVITIKECIDIICSKYSIKQAEKLLMELLWKEFFMQVQHYHGNNFLIQDIRNEKTGIPKQSILPKDLVEGGTGTDWVDEIVNELTTTGRLHNHKRMWLASRCCHRARLDWVNCARRTYYHFVDGELSSNHLSWQRVNSTFASKPYFMNNDNIEKYWKKVQSEDLSGTYEQVNQKLFSPSRTTKYIKGKTSESVLQTSFENLQQYNSKMLKSMKENNDDQFKTLYVLTPRMLSEEVLSNENVLVVLDEKFTYDYPRSDKRLAFVKQYTDNFNVPFVYGSYEEIVKEAITKGIKVILDERRDPIYFDFQKSEAVKTQIEAGNIKILQYATIYKPNKPIYKFFKYRNKAKKNLPKKEINNEG